jgi:hypothetical protein
LKATAAQIASTTPNGQVPARNPYALDSKHPQPNAKMNPRPRRSSAYMSIMKVTAAAPKRVSTPASVAGSWFKGRSRQAAKEGNVSDYVTLEVADNEAMAELIKQRLDEVGIPNMVVPSDIAAVAGAGASYAVRVPAERAEEARELFGE